MTSHELIAPHGGKLINLFIEKDSLPKKIKDAKKYFYIKLTPLEFSDLIMLGTGAFSPLQGYIDYKNYNSILDRMRLINNCLWPIPITLSVTKQDAKSILEGDKITLVYPNYNTIVGTMVITEKYEFNKKMEAIKVFETNDTNHPGVKQIYKKKDFYIAGPIELFSEGSFPTLFPEYSRPIEVRNIFQKKGWRNIIAFQTRNPMLRSHEYITKTFLKIMDGLFIHPIVGLLKEGDIPARIRMECYRTLIKKYYPQERIVFKVYPMEMRYGGPRETILHAIIRQNFGCNHFIVGRDHAGVGNYYAPYDSQNIFLQLEKKDLLIKILKIDEIFWCRKCKQMVSIKTCPHTKEFHFSLSGTKLREMIKNREKPPDFMIRKEIFDILTSYYKDKKLI